MTTLLGWKDGKRTAFIATTTALQAHGISRSLSISQTSLTTHIIVAVRVGTNEMKGKAMRYWYFEFYVYDSKSGYESTDASYICSYSPLFPLQHVISLFRETFDELSKEAIIRVTNVIEISAEDYNALTTEGNDADC